MSGNRDYLPTKTQSRAEEHTSPPARASAVHGDETPNAHPLHAGQRRRGRANCRDELGEQQPARTMCGMRCIYLSILLIRLQRDLSELTEHCLPFFFFKQKTAYEIHR